MIQMPFVRPSERRGQWKYSWLLCLVLCVSGAIVLVVDGQRPAEATCIVGIRTPSETILASDELRRSHGGDKAITTACKIYQGASHVYFAAAGVSFALHGQWISPNTLLSPGRFTGSNTYEQVRSAINSLQSDMSNAWLDLSRSNAQLFAQVVEGHATHVIFGWTDDKVPGVASYSAIPLAGGYSSSPEIKFFPNPHIISTRTDTNWMAGGECQQLVKDQLREHNSLSADPPVLAKQLVKFAIETDAMAHRDIIQRTMGLPVDVLVITFKGAHLYEREAASKCFELP